MHVQKKYRDKIIKQVKTVQEMFDKNMVSELLVIKYLVNNDLEDYLQDKDRGTIKEFAYIAAEKYDITERAVYKYIYPRDKVNYIYKK